MAIYIYTRLVDCVHVFECLNNYFIGFENLVILIEVKRQLRTHIIKVEKKKKFVFI